MIVGIQLSGPNLFHGQQVNGPMGKVLCIGMRNGSKILFVERIGDRYGYYRFHILREYSAVPKDARFLEAQISQFGGEYEFIYYTVEP